MDKEAALRAVDNLTDESDAISSSLDNTLDHLRTAVRTAYGLGVSQAELARRSRRHRNTIKLWCKD
jgi:DNA-directed RNA polymerase specialized sigma24 family protein